MKRLLIAASFAVGLWAQSSQTVYFHARMLPTNEVPATDFAGVGSSTILVHVMRNAAGEVVSGSVDFNVTLGLSGQADLNITGLHIHRGAAGVNGPVVIDSGIARGPITVPVVSQKGNVLGTNEPGVAALRDLLRDPGAFYVNIHTAAFPGGAVRGQLEPAVVTVLGAAMGPDQEVPAVPIAASGGGAVIAVHSLDQNGNVAHGSVQFAAAYTLTAATTITGFHIHRGDAGVNGPVVINSSIPAQLPAPPEGLVGVVLPGGFVEMITPVQVDTLSGLVNNPAGHYLNIHNVDYPGGFIRGQLSRAEITEIPFVATGAEEVPAITGLTAQTTGSVGILTQRNEDGTAKLGAVFFNVHHRFPGEITFTGMHVHRGAAGANGPVVFNSGLPPQFPSATGFGHISLPGAPVYKPEQLDILNELLRSPENFYFNIHTSVNPGGANRAQLGRVPPAPSIRRVSSANLVTDNIAPGGLFTVFGENLAKLRGTLEGWAGTRLPDLLNGSALTIGGQRARIIYVSGDQINAQAPFETPLGMQQVVVGNGTANGSRDGVRVVAAAPAIFVAGSQAYIVHANNGSLVTPDNPAVTGEMLWVFYTGGGVTTPALQTGQLVPPMGTFNTATATATIGGMNAEVRSSIANPGLAGVYRASVIVPSGAQPGARALLLNIAGNASNAADVTVR